MLLPVKCTAVPDMYVITILICGEILLRRIRVKASTIWPLGAAWLCLHIFEHYEYTQDIEFLKTKYPLMREAAEFFTLEKRVLLIRVTRSTLSFGTKSHDLLLFEFRYMQDKFA